MWTAQPAETQRWSFFLPAGSGAPAYHLAAFHLEGGAPVAARLAVAAATTSQTPALLCLADGSQDTVVSVKVATGVPEDGPPLPSQPIGPGTWQAVAIQAAPRETAPGEEQSLSVQVVSTGAADVWFVVSEPLSALTPDPLLPWLGGQLQQQGQSQAAWRTWEQYTALKLGTTEAARGLLG